MSSSVLNHKTPYEILHGQPPSYTYLKTFGSLCFISAPKHNREKFAPRGNPCVFFDYPYGKKAYKVYDLKSKKVFSSRDIHFYGTYFPFHHITESSPSSPLPSPIFLHYDHTPNSSNTPTPSCITSTTSPLSPPHSSASPSISSPTSSNPHPSSTDPSSSMLHLSSHDHFPPLRRSARPHRTLAHLQDYICSSAVSSSSTDPFAASHFSNFCSLVQFYDLPINSPVHSKSFLSLTEPTSCKQASLDPLWVKTMESEIQALHANNTWNEVELPHG